MNYIMLFFQLFKTTCVMRFSNPMHKLFVIKCNELSPIKLNNLTDKNGVDYRFVNDTTTKLDNDILENIAKNTHNKELLSKLENNMISINTKIDLINQFKNIELYNNIFAGGLMKDYKNEDFD